MNEGRIIAIGDIHGCSTALATLIATIQPMPLDTLIFLGEYIDRGPDSRGVIEQVIRLGERCLVVPLLGNHEEMLLGALKGKDNVGFWLKFGGRETLASYGTAADVIPAEHIRFVRGCKNYYETVGYIFVHAFYDPDRPLHERKWDGLRWAALPPDPKPHSSGKVAGVGCTAQKHGEILNLSTLKCIEPFGHGDGWLTVQEVSNGKVWLTDPDRKWSQGDARPAYLIGGGDGQERE